jgi:hypothetical protein
MCLGLTENCLRSSGMSRSAKKNPSLGEPTNPSAGEPRRLGQVAMVLARASDWMPSETKVSRGR